MLQNQDKLDRSVFKRIKHMNREEMNQVFENVTTKAVQRGYERGIREASICLFYALNKEYGFGNQRIEKVFTGQTTLLGIIHEGKETVARLQETLVKKGVTCLKDDTEPAPEAES